MRLKQNWTNVRELGSAVSAELRLEWSSNISLLQVHPKKCRRRMRISKKEFCSRLYRTGHFGQSSYQGESDERNDAPDDPGDAQLRPRADVGAVVAGGEAQFAARCDEVRQADRQEYLLMRREVVRLLGAVHVRVDAISQRRPQEGLIRTGAGCESDCQDGGDVQGRKDNPESFKIAVQAYDTWLPVNFDPGALGDHAEVFTMSEPSDADSIKDLAATPGDRAMYFHWLAEESDVESCTHLWQPRHLAPPRSSLQMDVLGRNAPLYFLGVWLQAAWLTEAEHRACMPDIGSMQLYKDAANSPACFFFSPSA